MVTSIYTAAPPRNTQVRLGEFRATSSSTRRSQKPDFIAAGIGPCYDASAFRVARRPFFFEMGSPPRRANPSYSFLRRFCP